MFCKQREKPNQRQVTCSILADEIENQLSHLSLLFDITIKLSNVKRKSVNFHKFQFQTVEHSSSSTFSLTHCMRSVRIVGRLPVANWWPNSDVLRWNSKTSRTSQATRRTTTLSSVYNIVTKLTYVLRIKNLQAQILESHGVATWVEH